MNKSVKIFVAGHSGLAGSAIVRALEKSGYDNLIVRSHNDLDLIDQKATRNFFNVEKPKFVVLAAAKVGGIYANSTTPAEFIYRNIAIQTNVIHESYCAGVEDLIFLGSSCIYPRDCPQPMCEEYLLTGMLEFTNRPYAIAKISGIEMCWSYNRQYGTRYMSLMPTNLYGIGDNYDLETSHVLPALIRKVHEAKIEGKKKVSTWGSGQAWREFLCSDDLGDACLFLLNLSKGKRCTLFDQEQPPLLNIGSGEELQIIDLVKLICEVVGFKGEIEWDNTKRDGTPRKLIDSSRIKKLGWRHRVDLATGIQRSYEDYLARLV